MSDLHGSARKKGWIGVDLDGTLAHYDRWQGVEHVGDPVPAMLERVNRWLADGWEVRVLTARVAPREDGSHFRARDVILEWCHRHVGVALEVTCVKDGEMSELWDDRCVAVEPNTGRALSPSRRGLE